MPARPARRHRPAQPARIPLVSVTPEDLDTIRAEGRLDPYVIYRVEDPDDDWPYGISPDGVGIYWYPTLQALTASHR